MLIRPPAESHPPRSRLESLSQPSPMDGRHGRVGPRRRVHRCRTCGAPFVREKSVLNRQKVTSREDATTYNNYYEFGVDKAAPGKYAHTLKAAPWSVKVDGLVGKPAEYSLDDLIKGSALEERIYRMRCVEGWSMVIPWIGFPLADLVKKVEPQGSAKYVAFETAYRPKEMPGLQSAFPVLDWPYVEGLRLDEAMNPLAILAVGMYGETLPNQNGAPIRLVVPWKYGFKGIKSIAGSASWRRSRRPPGTGRPPTSMGFTRTSTRGRSPALEPGHRAPHRGKWPVRQTAPDDALQRVCRTGGTALCRHGPEEALLNAHAGPEAAGEARASAGSEDRPLHRRIDSAVWLFYEGMQPTGSAPIPCGTLSRRWDCGRCVS